MSLEDFMFAVVTCVYNRPEKLRPLLRQLEHQTDTNFEVLMTLNNSDLQEFVEQTIADSELPIHLQVNTVNRGPFSKLEMMHQASAKYEWFMTLDDDFVIGSDLVEIWRTFQTDPALVQGFRGWDLRTGYWGKLRVQPGRTCHFLWSGNMMVHQSRVERADVLELDERYWHCDDLWFSYYCTMRLDSRLVARSVPAFQKVDGKNVSDDAGKRRTKTELMAKLVKEGQWQFPLIR